MDDVQLILSALWVALMLTYLLGDVLRIYAGDFKPGEIEGAKMTQGMLMVMAILMLIPIVMVFLSLTLDYFLTRLANIIVAGFFFLFNLVGLRSYPGAYDKFLLIVSMGFNVLTVFYAWTWIL